MRIYLVKLVSKDNGSGTPDGFVVVADNIDSAMGLMSRQFPVLVTDLWKFTELNLSHFPQPQILLVSTVLDDYPTRHENQKQVK